jgi:hypothetical protein
MENINPKTDVGYIYALCDPVTGQEMYIGQTIKKLKYRLSMHLTKINLKFKTKKTTWIESLLREGLKPLIKILKITDVKYLNREERTYIKKYRLVNPDLKNTTNGGAGGGLVLRSDTKKVKCHPIDDPSNVKFFNSSLECADYLKRTKSRIHEAANETKRIKLVNNHVVAYLDNEFPKEIIKQFPVNYSINCSNGNRYETLSDACIDLKFDRDKFIKHLKEKSRRNTPYYKFSGYQFWRDNEEPPKAKIKGRPILCSNGITYNNAVEASKELSLCPKQINNVLKGRSKTCHRYNFSYLK